MVNIIYIYWAFDFEQRMKETEWVVSEKTILKIA